MHTHKSTYFPNSPPPHCIHTCTYTHSNNIVHTHIHSFTCTQYSVNVLTRHCTLHTHYMNIIIILYSCRGDSECIILCSLFLLFALASRTVPSQLSTPRTPSTPSTPGSPAKPPNVDKLNTLQRKKLDFSTKLQNFKIMMTRLGFSQGSRLKFNIRHDHLLEDAYI